jgi:hypothetical protein
MTMPNRFENSMVVSVYMIAPIRRTCNLAGPSPNSCGWTVTSATCVSTCRASSFWNVRPSPTRYAPRPALTQQGRKGAPSLARAQEGTNPSFFWLTKERRVCLHVPNQWRSATLIPAGEYVHIVANSWLASRLRSATHCSGVQERTDLRIESDRSGYFAIRERGYVSREATCQVIPECREHAKRCLALASETTNPMLRDSLEDTARRWARLAVDLERTRLLLDACGNERPKNAG